MNIAVFAGKMLNEYADNDEGQLIEIVNQLALLQKENHFFLITDIPGKNTFPIFPTIQSISTGFKATGGLLKKYRWDNKLSKILRNVKADVFISTEKLSSFTLPQILLVLEGNKITAGSLKKSKLIAASSIWHKNELVKSFKIKTDKIIPVFSFANNQYKPATESIKENIKTKYSEGKEYFLLAEKNIRDDAFISILKSFSHFKKRQQSSMKVVILTMPKEKSLKSLSTYKYRNDIVIADKIMVAEEADLTGSSYAVLISQTNTQPVLNSLNAMQCEVPVIAATHPAIQEIAGDAVLYSQNESVKDLGDQMIRIYTDEKLRDEQIRKGRIVVKNYSMKHTADLLWNCIIKAVK